MSSAAVIIGALMVSAIKLCFKMFFFSFFFFLLFCFENLDSSYKMDLDFRDCFGRETALSYI